MIKPLENKYDGFNGVELLEEINLQRGNKVSFDIESQLFADYRKQQVCSNKDFSHDGYLQSNFWNSGEILAKDFDDIDSTIVAWLNSPSHNKVMLDNQYNKVGISSTGKCVVVIFKNG